MGLFNAALTMNIIFILFMKSSSATVTMLCRGFSQEPVTEGLEIIVLGTVRSTKAALVKSIRLIRPAFVLGNFYYMRPAAAS
jgi:hypothetical protein